MSSIRIALFGKFYIQSDHNLIQKLQTRKAEELLTYLLLHRRRPHPRDSLADVLWGNITPEQSKNYLRKALWQLLSDLEPIGGQAILLVEGDWIRINPEFSLWLDIQVLEEAYQSTRGMRGGNLSHNQAQIIRSATEFYRGDLLEGCYHDWCIIERESLQHQFLALLDKLVDHCQARHLYDEGLMYAEKILRHDRARERTHRRVMRLHYLSGHRTSALRQYRKCQLTLREELDVEPADKTRQLYEFNSG